MAKQYSIMTMGKDGPVVGMSIEGVEEVQAELDFLADKLKDETSVAMVTDVGNAVVGWMKENVLKQGLFKTGALYNSITAVTLTNEQGAACFVGPNTETVPYAMIQEFGGVIPAHYVAPVHAKALHWQEGELDFFSKGHMVGIKKPIIIQARPYMAPAYDDHAEEIKDIMMEDFYGAVTAGCADL